MMTKILNLVLALTLLTFTKFSFATDNNEIISIQEELNSFSYDVSKRIDYLTKKFQGKPYVLGNLGEGLNAAYDTDPIFRFDAFDCTTFVETITSMALSETPEAFIEKVVEIRYKNSQISYVNRNHFISVDWLPNNSHIFEDISYEIIGEKQKKAVATFNKKDWYAKKSINEISSNLNDRDERLVALQQEGRDIQNEVGTINYVSIKDLFDSNKQPRSEIFKRIPTGSVVMIVRPNWNIREKAGTNMNVSHMGFVIQKDNKTLFRHASNSEMKVYEQELSEYLKTYYYSDSVKGIALFRIK